MSTDLNFETLTQAGYRISTDKTLFDVDAAYDMIANQSYWAQGMPKERFETAVANSMCFGIYFEGKTVGLGRVITDHGTFAYICDVFISNKHRGKGLGKWLIYTMRTHPDLQGLRRWSLATNDAHRLYGLFGFVPITKPETWMEIRTPYITQNEGN